MGKLFGVDLEIQSKLSRTCEILARLIDSERAPVAVDIGEGCQPPVRMRGSISAHIQSTYFSGLRACSGCRRARPDT